MSSHTMQVFSQFLGVNISDFWRLGFDGGVFQYNQYVVKVGSFSAHLVVTLASPCEL